MFCLSHSWMQLQLLVILHKLIHLYLHFDLGSIFCLALVRLLELEPQAFKTSAITLMNVFLWTQTNTVAVIISCIVKVEWGQRKESTTMQPNRGWGQVTEEDKFHLSKLQSRSSFFGNWDLYNPTSAELRHAFETERLRGHSCYPGRNAFFCIRYQ